MSHKSTIQYIDVLGIKYDEPVKNWCRDMMFGRYVYNCSYVAILVIG